MYNAELSAAVRAASKVAEFLRKNKEAKVDSFLGKDIKLAADKLAEEIILKELAATNIPVLSEEAGFVGEKARTLWVVDPLDGTFNYYKGLRDLCCVSIALIADGKPVLGVIDRFARKELFTGVVGEGAFLNGEKIAPSAVEKVEKAALATGFPVKMEYSAENIGKFIRRAQAFKKVRMLGSAALMGAFTACGRVDAYMEEDILLWDIAAAAALARAAGCETYLKEKDSYKCALLIMANKALSEDFKKLEGES